MPTADHSSSALTRVRRGRALVSVNKGDGTAQTNTVIHAGIILAQCCASVAPVACQPPGPITNFNADISGGQSDGFGGFTPILYDISWNPVPGAISYTVTSIYSDLTNPSPPDTIEITGPTSRRISFPYIDGKERIFTVTANTSCGTASATLTVNPCFLAGSLVQMADGSAKVIEEVRVGDLVLGAFGEINAVLALHRPLLGSVATMCRINEEHSTTNHHPHISTDKQFYCGDPDLVESTTYGREHEVINGEGDVVRRFLHGLRKGRVQPLIKGINLKTVEGYRTVKRIEMYGMPPDTQLYNLVVGGSHTYHVDGYAVTGWPREDDFDYDRWIPTSDWMCSGCGLTHD